MKHLLVLVMLSGVTTATSVFADSLDAGLGADRSTLSKEQIADRSARLEATTSFSLLRNPDALQAPARIFRPDIWKHIETAARANDLDPFLLAGMIFIESYGNPTAKSPTGPAGIAQMTRGSARELGLVTDRKVRVGTTTIKQTRWVGKGKTRRRIVKTVKKTVYKTIDERYIPSRAIDAMARRVSSRRAWLGGKVDFAVAEYHMGAGRMSKLLSTYFGRTIRPADVPSAMSQTELSYPELYWTNTPYFRPEVFEALDDLNQVDYSPTYYFRVKQAMRLLRTYRESPAEYARLASVHQGKFGWSVLPSAQWSFVSDPLPVAPAAGPLHQDAGERFVLLPDLASQLGVRGEAPMTAERSTIGSALFVAQHLRRLQGDRYQGFEIARMLVPELPGCTSYGAAAHDPDAEDGNCAPLHTLGWAFDVNARDLSKTDRRDLKFILTDLRQAGLLTYVEESKGPSYHIVRHPEYAARFEQFYWDAMAGSAPERPQAAPPTTVASAGFAPVAEPAEQNEAAVEVGVEMPRTPAMLGVLSQLVSRILSIFT